MGKRLQMTPTSEYILWAVIRRANGSTYDRSYGPFRTRSAAYSAKTALINHKRSSMRAEGYDHEEIEAVVRGIVWSSTQLWSKVDSG